MSGIVEKRVRLARKRFNFNRYDELFENPPDTLTNPNGDSFSVDEDVFRKLQEYIYNMVFKNLDIFFLCGGEEGTGKSTDASQVAYMFYYIIVECHVITKESGTWYEFDLKEIMGHNLKSFLIKCNEHADDLFRIFICDEAGDLKAEDRWEESNKLFRSQMRKDRKELKIRILCYPNPFELVKDTVLGRINSIRMSKFREDKKRGLSPDQVDHIIIPRGPKTFSCHTRQIVEKSEVKAGLGELFKTGRYTSELPKKYVFKTSKKDDVFCFDADEYIKKAKLENKLYETEKKISITEDMAKIIAKRLTPSKIGLKKRIPKDAPIEELDRLEKESKEAGLIHKLVNMCKERFKMNNE